MCCRAIAAGLALALLAAEAAAQAQQCPAPAGPAQPGAAASACEAALEQGNALLRAGQAAEALAAYREAEAQARAQGDARVAALAAANAARAAALAGQLDGAEAEIERAVAAAAALDDAGLRATLLLNAARTSLLLAERRSDGAAARRRAAELLTRAEAEAARAGDARLRSFAQGWLGTVYESAGRLEDAATLTRRALFEADRARAPDALYRWHWQLGRIERAAGREEPALEAYRRAVAELDLLRPGLALGSAEAQLAFRSEIEPVYRGLVDLLLRRSETAPADARQALLAEARNTLEALKAAELRDHFHDECLDAQRKATPDDVPGTAVLYPVLLPDRVELVVSNETGLSRHTVPVAGPALEDEARELRRLLSRRTTLEYLAPAHRLYELLIRPVWPQLAGRTLVVVPDGALRTIPFAALRDEAEGRFLIQKLPLASSPGLTLTDPRPIDRESVQLLAVGLAESVAGYPPLPAVAGELDTVAQAFPSVVLLDRDFVADRLEGEVARRPVSIVHVASHGEFRGEADESFVLAWDGPIPMERLASVVGRTRYRAERPLELLVLSACETASGDERASLGLAGVAVRAGARSAVGSLWRVSDEATALLIEEFYTQLADPAVSRAEALRRAQQRLLAEVRFRHPFYWSPFLLISNWL